MSKKVIGIAVIAGLDLAFIVLMQAGWDPSEVSQTIEPPNRYQQSLTQKQSLPELVAPVETEAVSDSDEPVAVTAATSRRANETSAIAQNVIVKKKHRRGRGKTRDAVESTPKFRDTVIYVKRSEPFQFQQVSYVEPKITTPEPIDEIRPESKRKSFLSKAAPIVKKPYEWIKDLAAKLK
jgi:hypothetical protein